MAFKDFITQFTDKKFGDVVKLGNKYFFPQDIKIEDFPKGKVPKYIGLYVGEDTPNGFRPSVIFLDILNDLTTKKAVIDSKAEWLFLCGRDIFGASVISLPELRGFVLINNEAGEVLGLGNVVAAPTSKGVCINNIFDKGDFLRRERKKSKR